MSLTTSMTLLNGATATGSIGSGHTQGPGDGPECKMIYPQVAAAVQAEINGSPTACVINILAMLDGSTWDTLCVLDISQGYLSGEIQPISFPAPIRYVKANLAALTGGVNSSVNCYFAAVG